MFHLLLVFISCSPLTRLEYSKLFNSDFLNAKSLVLTSFNAMFYLFVDLVVLVMSHLKLVTVRVIGKFFDILLGKVLEINLVED